MKPTHNIKMVLILGLVTVLLFSTPAMAEQKITDPEDDVIHITKEETQHNIATHPDIDITEVGFSIREKEDIGNEVSLYIKVKGKLDLDGKELTVLINTTEQEQIRINSLYSMIEYQGIGDLSTDFSPRVKGSGTNKITIIAEDYDIPDDVEFSTIYIKIQEVNPFVESFIDVAEGHVSGNTFNNNSVPGFELITLIISVAIAAVLIKKYHSKNK